MSGFSFLFYCKPNSRIKCIGSYKYPQRVFLNLNFDMVNYTRELYMQ